MAVCITCGGYSTRQLGEGNYWCERCGTLSIGNLPGFDAEVTVPEVLEELQEWRAKYQRPTSQELRHILRGIGE